MRDVVLVTTHTTLKEWRILKDIIGGREFIHIGLPDEGPEARLRWEDEVNRLPANCRVIGIGKTATHALMGRKRNVKDLLGKPFFVRPGVQGLITHSPATYSELKDRRYLKEIERAIEWAYSEKQFPPITIHYVDELPKKYLTYVMDLEWTWGQWIGDPGQELTAVGFMPVEGPDEAYILNKPFNKKVFREGLTIIGHNTSGDVGVLMRNAYSLPPMRLYDTICLLKTYNPVPEFTYGLKQWGTYLGFPGYAMTVHEQQNAVSEMELHTYLAKDLYLTRELYRWAEEQRKAQPEKLGIDDLESDAILPNATMINTGIPVSEKRLREYRRDLMREYILIRARLRAKYDWPELNMSSHHHIGKLLFDILKLPQIDGRHAGEEILQVMPGEVPKLILRFRALHKKRTTYVDPFLAALRKGRIYADSNLHGAATGRLTRHKPPVQTPPRDMRDQFEAEEGRVMLSSDIDQLEFRLVADVSGEEKLYDSKDVHEATARFFFEKDNITKDERAIAKTGNYAGLYGAFPKKIAATLNCSEEEAAKFLLRMEQVFPRIAAFKGEVERAILSRRRISSPFGREWDFSHIEDSWKLKQAVRQAVNRIIQSMGHDMMLCWWIMVHRELKKEDRLVNEIHDELLFEIRKEAIPRIEKLCYTKASKVKEEVKRRFDYDLQVPFTISVKCGKVWSK